jgi:tRNA threonylcarbamoyl adenosine modification protein YeaZ
MKGLYIDVSTEVMYVGYALNGKLTDQKIRIAAKDHAAFIIDQIDSLLTRNQLTLDDIDYIVCGAGPGSYTGIRVAVTTSKTLAYAKNIKLYQVSSLIFMTSGYEGFVDAQIDARRGYVFHTVYDKNKVIIKDRYTRLSEIEKESLNPNVKTVLISKDTYKVAIETIDKFKQEILDIHAFEPNYTRITEAEEHAHKTRN